MLRASSARIAAGLALSFAFIAATRTQRYIAQPAAMNHRDRVAARKKQD
jgi:hypothetical protein